MKVIVMSTHANIAVVDVNTSDVISVYLHCDGYFDHAGQILIENYNNYNTAISLVLLGNMSVLGETAFECKHYVEEPTTLEFNEWIEKHFTQEFNYIFMGGRWFVYNYVGRNFTMLEDIV
jgi:hypothetical protein